MAEVETVRVRRGKLEFAPVLRLLGVLPQAHIAEPIERLRVAAPGQLPGVVEDGVRRHAEMRPRLENRAVRKLQRLLHEAIEGH